MIGLAAAQLQEFLVREFPFTNMQVEAVGDGQARVRMPVLPRHLRPGGTVSGPTLMTLADTAMYMALLGEIGLVALAVTTSLTINFLRRPAAGGGGGVHLLGRPGGSGGACHGDIRDSAGNRGIDALASGNQMGCTPVRGGQIEADYE